MNDKKFDFELSRIDLRNFIAVMEHTVNRPELCYARFPKRIRMYLSDPTGPAAVFWALDWGETIILAQFFESYASSVANQAGRLILLHLSQLLYSASLRKGSSLAVHAGGAD